MSVIFYKFKSARDYDKCVFDGSSISVFELKREIMISKNLSGGVDFDLVMYNAQTSEEYKDDSQMLPRNTSVLVSRRPAVAPAKGTAQRYLASVVSRETRPVCPTQYYPSSGSTALRSPGSSDDSKIGGRVINSTNISSQVAAIGVQTSLSLKSSQKSESSDVSLVIEGVTEEERIDNMFKQQAKQWKASQRMSQQKAPIKPRRQPVNRSINNNYASASANSNEPKYDRGSLDTNTDYSLVGSDKTAFKPSNGFNTERPSSTSCSGNSWTDPMKVNQRAPPPGYICYRCGKKGHFISSCPTIGDKDFDRPKLKRTTGIPKIFLKTVDNPQSSCSGVMIAQTGELVIAQPNDFEWKKLYTKTKNSLGPGNIYELVEKDSPPEYRCGICERLCRDPVSTSCCETKYCYECINFRLLDNEDRDKRLRCPSCSRSQAPENLMPRDDIRTAIENLLREFVLKQNNSGSDGVEKDAPAGTENSNKFTFDDTNHNSESPGNSVHPLGNAETTSTQKIVPNSFQRYVVPRRKRISKPFTIISAPQTPDVGSSQADVETSESNVRVGYESTDTNSIDAAASVNNTTAAKAMLHGSNHSRPLARPFSIISSESDNSSKVTEENSNISSVHNQTFTQNNDMSTGMLSSSNLSMQIISIASRKSRNPIKIIRSVSSDPTDASNDLNNGQYKVQACSETGTQKTPLRPSVDDQLYSTNLVTDHPVLSKTSSSEPSKRIRLSANESPTSLLANSTPDHQPNYENTFKRFSGDARPFVHNIPTHMDTGRANISHPNRPSLAHITHPVAFQDPTNDYKPMRSCAMSQQGKTYLGTPYNIPISTFPLKSHESSGSPYSTMFASSRFLPINDVNSQAVRSFKPVRFQPSSRDMFATDFRPLPGIPLFSAPFDLSLRGSSAPDIRRRFAPSSSDS